MSVDRKGRPLGIVEGLPQRVTDAEVRVCEYFSLPDWAKELQDSHWLPEKVIIADPLFYCAGVDRAIIAADNLLRENAGQTVYFYHAPIHNKLKVDEWEGRGAKIVNSIAEIPYFSPTLLSAHGVGPSVWLEVQKRGLRGKDAMCPLVKKTHIDVDKFVKQGYKVLLIGKKDHDEVVGTFDHAPDDIIVIAPNISFEEMDKKLEELKGFDKLALTAQTTLVWKELVGLIEHICDRRPDLKLPNVEDVCYATQNRQEAVLAAIAEGGADLVIVFGSDESKGDYRSNNSISLREVAKGAGAASYLAEDISEVKAEWFYGYRNVGISAGASAAPERVAEFIACLREIGLKSNQISRMTVVYEDQNFTGEPESFDFSKVLA